MGAEAVLAQEVEAVEELAPAREVVEAAEGLALAQEEAVGAEALARVVGAAAQVQAARVAPAATG